MAPPTSPNFGGTANFEMSWETNLCNNYLEALGAALRSPGIAGIKRPAVGSDPSCWNCCPSLHLDLPIRGPQKILTCYLYCNLDSSQDCPLGNKPSPSTKLSACADFELQHLQPDFLWGSALASTHPKSIVWNGQPVLSLVANHPWFSALKHPKTIPYPAKLAPKRHILQEVFQFICIYLPLGQTGPKHHDSRLGYFSPVGWTWFFLGVSMGILHRHHQHDFGSSSCFLGILFALYKLLLLGVLLFENTWGPNSKHVYTQVEKVPARLFRCFK